MVEQLTLPARYESLEQLGKGGGGEVWAVRDRHTGSRYALKVLAEGATEGEMAALVREAVTLSGLEGLGVPRVLRFGRLPATGRPFMVRELVEGRSLQELIDERAEPGRCVEALVGAAEQTTLLHRAGLLHGDIKPANIIVEEGGRATLVDLGLAAPWREQGSAAKGLTPKYAAPELFLGKPLTVRAEVYALGVTLSDVLEEAGERLTPDDRAALAAVAERATSEEPADRFPSADEFAAALRRAARMGHESQLTVSAASTWPIVGIEATASRLVQTAIDLPRGETLSVDGELGSGRSVLLRRLAWSLGMEGRPVAWIDESLVQNPAAVEAELAGFPDPGDLTILVDDADQLHPDAVEPIAKARDAGARLILVGDGPLGRGGAVFEVPPLGPHAAMELLRRAVPSLTERLIRRVVEHHAARPGELRKFVRMMASRAVASDSDVEALLTGSSGAPSLVPADPIERATHYLDRGRFDDARAALDTVRDGHPLTIAVQRSRLELGLGNAVAALAHLEAVEKLVENETDATLRQTFATYMARAHIMLGRYPRALELLETVEGAAGALGAEALSYQGLAHSYLNDAGLAESVIERAVSQARDSGSARVEAVALAALGVVRQRADNLEGARDAYTQALAAAERASDAGNLSIVQLNLAQVLKLTGDLAGAIEHYEAAVDMGRRSGRRVTVMSALANLANTDLYLGRIARARASIESIEAQEAHLDQRARAHLSGLRAELFEATGAGAEAVQAYEACAAAYEELGRGLDAGEARLAGVLIAARLPDADGARLAERVRSAEALLGESHAHVALLLLARAGVAWAEGDEGRARQLLGDALKAAREAGMKDWVWRALEARAEIEEAEGQRIRARRDREEALSVLEEIATRLPRDLREVFWNDPRRRSLRAAVEGTLGTAPTEHSGHITVQRTAAASVSSSITSLTSTPLEKRLARILEVNAELLGEIDLERLTARVTDLAVEMLKAERGFVLLLDDDGQLTVHTSRTRAGDEPHQEFSRSVAETVVLAGEPVVSLNARRDVRMEGFASVHQLMLESVACVPIRARSGPPIGALYVETRLKPGQNFERELPTLQAFADQVGIAIETAKLIVENRSRAEDLERANVELEQARDKLAELLGDRTEQLKRTRQKLRDARETLFSHFGYQGLVGTSAAMRRVYALIDRVKDTEVPVLITGESGTGKEVAARAIHKGSQRSKMPFLGVNCGAIPEHLLESELFGHVRGAFTGADRERKGLLREAEGGTVLLDEIGEMPHKMQAGLLRVLQDKMVRPVGGTHEEAVDIRLIFATHRDLGSMVKSGAFREDLFYRIHVVELQLPPLRERVEDIAPLVDHFLGIFAARYKRERRTVSREGLRRLAAFSWPGNVRQLEHVLLNAWILSDGSVLEVDDFDLPDGRPPSQRFESSAVSEPDDVQRSGGAPGRRRETISKHRKDEKDRIIQALQACNWNRVKAAELSGIPRRTFYRRLREYGIQ